MSVADRMRQFNAFEVRDLCERMGMPFNDESILLLGLARELTQRECVLAAWHVHGDVDAVFEALHRAVPKSSIRSYLGKAQRAGTVDGSWRKNRPRRARSRAWL